MVKLFRIADEDPMVTFCRMIRDMGYNDIPNNVIKFAKQIILDTMGNIIGGSAMEGIPQVVDMIKEKGGKPESLIPFYGGKVPASEAGMAIGPMSRAMDFAPIHPEAMHNSEHTLPSLLAATGLRKKVTGKEFITAFVLGQEILLRIGIAFKPSIGVTLGRSNGHYIFGSVACVGKLLDLNQEQLENAEGIARQMTQPRDMAAFHPVTHMVKVHQGFICQDAINACLLAQRGITGPRQEVLTGPRGYLGFAKWQTDPEALTRRLGEQWEMLNVELKPYPGCKSLPTSITGILDQMEQYGFGPEDIASIHFDQPPLSWELVCEPIKEKRNPKSEYECQFSLPYVVATAIYDKDIMPNSFSVEARTRQHIRTLMTKITAKKDADLPPWSTRVTTDLTNGNSYSGEYYPKDVKGSPKNPFTESELIDKFKKCITYSAYPLSDTTVDSIIDSILNMEKLEDIVQNILIPLTPMQA